MTVMKEEVYIRRSQETGGIACHAGPQGEALGSFRGRRGERNDGQKPFF